MESIHRDIASGRPTFHRACQTVRRNVCKEYLAGVLDFFMIAPERLSVPGFPEMIAKRRPTLIAVDEAHCISSWGMTWLYDETAKLSGARAREFFGKACNLGDTKACGLLGYMTQKGDAIDNQGAAMASEMACREGEFKACLNLGVFHYRNNRGDDDLVMARGLFEQACAAGVARACTFCGYMWETGEGGPQDTNKSRTLYQQGCEAGDKNGCAALKFK